MVIDERKPLNFPGFIQKVITRTVGAIRSCKFCTVPKHSGHCGSRQAHHTMMYLTCIFPLCSRLLCAPLILWGQFCCLRNESAS